MQNPDANLLPEVDSLPDGFNESATEPLAPATQTPEEKPLSSYKDDGSTDLSHSNELSNELTEKKFEDNHAAVVPLETKALPGKPEIGEKCKSAKLTLKSEKELSEFTLKYQQVLAERDAALAVRDKLESLCRELQCQNKMLMEECKRVSTEQQTLRLDLSAKFQDAIKDLRNKFEEQNNESLSPLKENDMLINKVKQLAEQYEICEQQYAQKQKSSELQLAELEVKQHAEKLNEEQLAELEVKQHAEKLNEEQKRKVCAKSRLSENRKKIILEHVQNIQEELRKDKENNESMKQIVEKLSESMKELKQQNLFLKNKLEKSNNMLTQLANERENLKNQLEKMKNQKDELESLCRSLHAERKQIS